MYALSIQANLQTAWVQVQGFHSMSRKFSKSNRNAGDDSGIYKDGGAQNAKHSGKTSGENGSGNTLCKFIKRSRTSEYFKSAFFKSVSSYIFYISVSAH